MAPVLVLLRYVIGPTPMDLQFWLGAVVMMLIATVATAFITNSGRSAWFVGALVLMVYLTGLRHDVVSVAAASAVKRHHDQAQPGHATGSRVDIVDVCFTCGYRATPHSRRLSGKTLRVAGHANITA